MKSYGVALVGLVWAGVVVGVAAGGCSSDEPGAEADASTSSTATTTAPIPTVPALDGSTPTDAAIDAAPTADGAVPIGAQDRVYVSNQLGLSYLPRGGGGAVTIDGQLASALRVIPSPGRTRVASTGAFGSTTSFVYDRSNTKVGTIPGVVIGWADDETVIFGTAGGAGNQFLLDLKKARFDASGAVTLYTPAQTNTLLRAGLASVAADGSKVALFAYYALANTLTVVSTQNGAVLGTLAESGQPSGPFFSKDGHVLWGNGDSYKIALPSLASPVTVSAGGTLASGNGNGPFNHWVGNDVLVGIETVGTGGLRVSKLYAAKTSGGAPTELSGVNAIGNMLVERTHVSADGSKIVYHSGAVVSTANADGTGAQPLGNVIADPQVIAW